MFLLGWPASTLSITSRCRGRETREVSRRRFSQLRQFAGILGQFESPLDACDEFLAADRLFDEIQRARFHGLNRHGHVGVAGDHDRRQAMAVAHGASRAVRARSFPADRRRSAGMRTWPDQRPRERPRSLHRISTTRPSSSSTARIASRTRSSSSTTMIVAPSEAPRLHERDEEAGRAVSGGLARSFSIARVNSFSLTGLLR